MSVVVLLSAVLIVPALAAPIDYNDYVTKVQVDGDNDLVTVTIPADLAFVCVYDSEGSEFYRGYGSTHDVVLLDHTRYKIEVYPFGYPWNGTAGLDLSYIPVGTRIASGFGITSDPYSATTIPTTSVLYWYDPGYTTVVYELPLEDSVDSPHFFAHAYSVDPPDNTSLLGSGFVLDGLSFLDEQIASIYVQDTQMVFTISSLLRQQQLTGKTNSILKEVEAQLAEQGKTLDDIKASQEETNEKLDDIISGGSAGDDLIDKNDQLTDIGDDLKEDMDQIQDFEDQYFNQFEDNLGDVVDAADISFIYVPLGFVQRYLNKIVAGIPSKYLIVFTLPMLFGLFLYIVGHPVRAPRPERKSDSESRNSLSASRSPAAAPQKEVKS